MKLWCNWFSWVVASIIRSEIKLCYFRRLIFLLSPTRFSMKRTVKNNKNGIKRKLAATRSCFQSRVVLHWVQKEPPETTLHGGRAKCQDSNAFSGGIQDTKLSLLTSSLSQLVFPGFKSRGAVGISCSLKPLESWNVFIIKSALKCFSQIFTHVLDSRHSLNDYEPLLINCKHPCFKP